MRNVFEAWKSPGCLWRQLCFVVLGIVTGTVGFSIVVVLLSLTGGLLVTLPLALPFAWLLFGVAQVCSRVERSRIASLLDVELLDPVTPIVRERDGWRGWLRRLRMRAGDGARWKEIGYHLLSLPVNLLGFAVILIAWCASTAFTLLPFYVDRLPGGEARFGLFGIGPGSGAWIMVAVGVVLLFLAPTVTRIVTWGQSSLAALLIGVGRDAALSEQVSRLERSRSAAVDAGEAERRRIERDLHDGAQQRLVALAASLGAAREKLENPAPEDAEVGRELVAQAHEESKAALREIRDLVRGIHPVILEDRGLDAALSAVVARSPVPVDLRIEPMERPPDAVESTAYFVVAEALTNIARHAGATRAEVAIARSGDRLVLEIRDDGVGGADEARGSGLAGLRDRIVGHGGTMHVLSPDGGPTTISVTVPCGS